MSENLLLANIHKEGKLVLKENSKEYRVILDKDLLQWFKEKPEGLVAPKKTKNYITFSAGCSVHSENHHDFAVKNTFETVSFSARTQNEKLDWIEAIEKIIHEVSSQARRGTILVGPKFDKSAGHQKTTLRRNSRVTEVRFFNSTRISEIYFKMFFLKQTLEKRGWLIVNKDKRWCWLRDNVLQWYDKSHENKQDPPSNVKGLQSLLGCSVREDPKHPHAFCIFSPTSKILFLQSMTKDAQGKKDIDDWVYYIHISIFRASSDTIKTDENGATSKYTTYKQMQDIKSGWLEEKKKKRFYLIRNTNFLCYDDEKVLEKKLCCIRVKYFVLL